MLCVEQSPDRTARHHTGIYIQHFHNRRSNYVRIVHIARPGRVITFSSTAACGQTTFNTALNRWETTLPLGDASKADEIFAAGLAYQIPAGFPNVNNVTWSANITGTAPGLQVTWQYGVSNWLASNKGTKFPALTSSPFVPDYSGMMINPVHNGTSCVNYGGDHAGTPEFAGNGNVLTGGGSGGGGSNFTGSWSSTPGTITLCGAPAVLLLRARPARLN